MNFQIENDYYKKWFNYHRDRIAIEDLEKSHKRFAKLVQRFTLIEVWALIKKEGLTIDEILEEYKRRSVS